MTSSRSVSLAPLAESDLRFILQHSLETWGERQRDEYAEAMRAAFVGIGTFPGIGRSSEDVAPGCRALPVEQHVIYYRVEEHTVRILRILHARMGTKGRVAPPERP
jgi:toxin ParE1/3/4